MGEGGILKFLTSKSFLFFSHILKDCLLKNIEANLSKNITFFLFFIIISIIIIYHFIIIFIRIAFLRWSSTIWVTIYPYSNNLKTVSYSLQRHEHAFWEGHKSWKNQYKCRIIILLNYLTFLYFKEQLWEAN